MVHSQHLNVTHVDLGALATVVARVNARSFLDVGCGPGGMVDWARWCGLESRGIDMDPAVADESRNILTHDLKDGPWFSGRSFDIVWSVEAAEHIPEGQTMENYITTLRDNLAVTGVLVMTNAGYESRQGVGHVTIRHEYWWVDLFRKHGLVLDAVGSVAVRQASTMAREFMRQSGKVFRRVE